MEQTKNKGTGQQVADKAKDAASSAADAARDAAGHVGQAVSSAASSVGRKAEDWTAAAGQKVENLADSVRGSGQDSGVLHQARGYVADGMEKAGEYLQDKNLSGMAGDITDLVKRNPIPALLIGLGVGYLLGKALRS